MNLKAERSAMAAALTRAEFTAFDHVPARPVGPFAMVVPGSPYFEDGDTFGTGTVRLDVWIVAGQGDTAALADALDEQIDRAVNALAADEYHVETVGQPIEWRPSSGGVHLVAILTTRTTITTA